MKVLDKIEAIIQHNQGNNPSAFDYRFNLPYGNPYTKDDPLFTQMRALIDADTAAHAGKNHT